MPLIYSINDRKPQFTLRFMTNRICDYPRHIQNYFIAKIYCILCLQLSITIGMTLIAFNYNYIAHFILQKTYILFVVSIISIYSILLSYKYGNIFPYNLAILAIFTITKSYIVVYISLYYSAITIIFTWSIILILFILLTLYAFIMKNDYYSENSLLLMFCILSVISVLYLVFIPYKYIYSVFISIFASIVFCAYILLDTSILLHKLTPDDTVKGCIDLYLDIINLFIWTLSLFDTD